MRVTPAPRRKPDRPPLYLAPATALAPGAWTDHPASGLRFWSGPGDPPPAALGAQLALEGNDFPLVVRARLPGDRVGGRKVQDLLIDRRVQSELRGRVPLVCAAGGRVVWIPGFWQAPGGGGWHLRADSPPGAPPPDWLPR